ncbi:hypothetical protein LOCC1_G006306 [Lachnellula occidentalis]|uniref:Uncharacterized protein n=1 Tax=Lachnellula occidentalis TaxID=215460 RepID=A0A8H8RSY6_9HELO|nr:hypothetical protein LOCC1_G006306 [Lachnellula occidentalis]
MPSLVVPESGMSLSSSADAGSKPGSVVPEVFGLTLSDSVIEDMIKCFQNDKPLQLSLGEHPSLSYGTKTQHLSTSDDPFTYELYRSTDSDSDAMAFYDKTSKKQELGTKKPKIIKVDSKPNATFMAVFGGKKFIPALKPPTAKPKATSSAGTDAALAQLQSSLATETARKAGNTTKYIKTGLPLPGQRKGAGKNKLLSTNRSLGSDTARSMPSSPALSGVRSPSTGPTSVPLSQQQAELAKTARKPIIHLLALGPTSERALREMLPDIGSNDFKQTLRKVGDLNESIGKHELRKSYWKELDVWSFTFPNQDDRQLAIDNAVKQYDRMRLGVSEPEWDRLLPKPERGTGKSLSKLQAQIARGDLQRPPKIKVQKEDGSGRETSGPEDEGSIKDKKVSKVKGESKSVSQSPSTKTKKVSEKEPAKKVLSKNTTKPTLKPVPKPTAAAKKREAAKTGTKVLSSEFVEDSDEESDFQQRTSKPPKPKPVAAKRPREDDVESSDSSIPLSKKVKKDTAASTIHRISDASQSSRTTNTSTNTSTQSSASTKTKDTSPQKSSPLASSPPTNASDVDNSSGDRTSSSSSASPANHLSSKNSRSPIHKRHHKSSSVASSVSSTSSRYLKPEVMDLARKYRSYYPRYEALHKELAGMKSRDLDKEVALLDMHERLAQMKREINEGIVEVN